MESDSGRSWQKYRVEITRSAGGGLKELAKKLGKPLFQQLRQAIEDLENDPEGKTQPLGGKLSGYRSLHVARCRVVIKIVDSIVTVFVIGAGWHVSGDRNDIYQRLIRSIEDGSLDPEQNDPGTGA